MTVRIAAGLSIIVLAAVGGCAEPIQQAQLPDVSPAPEAGFDLGTVTYEQLTSINGIGPKRAAAILEFRDSYGFKRVEDLLAVEGIGENTYLRIRRCFYVDAQENSEQ
jgi:competence ComEA-like helix-hairpin-helix protein